MLIKVERKAVVTGHNRKVHLQKPTGRMRVLFAKLSVSDTLAKNEE